MLPTNEIDTLTTTVVDAMDLAQDGEVSQGYDALLWGLNRAEEMLEEGLPWAEELVDRWRLVCHNYAERYGPKLG